jgi:hypothetical protein
VFGGGQRGGVIYTPAEQAEIDGIHSEAVAGADALLRYITGIPPVDACAALLNAFSCYLNKYNSLCFSVDRRDRYDLSPNDDEIAFATSCIRNEPVGHYDDLSLPAYFAAKEAEWMSNVPPGFARAAGDLPDITNRAESSGPLFSFAQFLGVSIGTAALIFVQIDNRKCIDDTVYNEILYDLWFCMFDLVPPADPIAGIDVGVVDPAWKADWEARGRALEVAERGEVMAPDPAAAAPPPPAAAPPPPFPIDRAPPPLPSPLAAEAKRLAVIPNDLQEQTGYQSDATLPPRRLGPKKADIAKFREKGIEARLATVFKVRNDAREKALTRRRGLPTDRMGGGTSHTYRRRRRKLPKLL